MTIARKKALEVLDFQWSRTGGAFHMHGNNHMNFVDKRAAVRAAVQIQILKAHEEGKTAPWDDRFAQLTEYVQRFGNADVPINYAENLSLGSWVYRQRIAHKLWQVQNVPVKVHEPKSEQSLRDYEATVQQRGQENEGIPDEPAAANHQKLSEESGNGALPEIIATAPGIETNPIFGDANPLSSELQPASVHSPPHISDRNQQSGESLQESVANMDQSTVSQTNGTKMLETTQVGIHSNSDVQPPSDINPPTNGSEMHSATFPAGAPQSIIANDFDITLHQSNNEPKFLEVDRMTQERFDKLVAVGFDFEIKKIPDDFITPDGQEPAALILSKTAEEEEKPLIEDEQDVLEIALGDDEVAPEENSQSKQEMEINEMEVSAILNENDVNAGTVNIENNSPMAEIQHETIHHNLNENVDSNLVPLVTKASEEVEVSGVGKLDMVDNRENATNIENNCNFSVDVNQQNMNHSDNVAEHVTNEIISEVQNSEGMNTDPVEKIEQIPNSNNNSTLNQHTSSDLQLIANDLDQKGSDEVTNSTELDINASEGQLKDTNDVSTVTAVVIASIDGTNGDQKLPLIETSVQERNENAMNPISTEEIVHAKDISQGEESLSLYRYDSKEPKVKKRKMSTTVRVEWEERILELVQYRMRKKNCNVPLRWKPNPGKYSSFSFHLVHLVHC